MQEFVTWEIIGTFAGAACLTATITHFIKNLGVIKKMPTQLLSYVIAFILLVLADIFLGRWTLSGFVLTIFNALLVSLATNGGYQVYKRLQMKNKE